LWQARRQQTPGIPLQAARELDKETQMKRMLNLTIALLLGAAVISPILGASQANACHYTSQDRAKGYKC
jgi:L-cystine uptake protein TcyP (sodium:dicarboxylate symporter family)